MLFAVVLLCLSQVNADFYNKASGVVDLNAKNFNKLVKKENQIYLVEFYAALQPEWVKAAKQLKGLVKENKPLAGQFGIKGFPTIKVFVGTGAPQDYQGERKADAIISYAQSLLPSLKSFKTAKALDEFLGASSSVPKALVFSDKSTSVPLKSVAFHFKNRLAFGEIPSSKDKSLATRFGVTTFPSVVIVPAGSKAAESELPRSADFSHQGLFSFASTHALPGDDDDLEGEGVPQIFDQSCFAPLCDKALCAIAILSGSDAAPNSAALRAVAAAGDSSSGDLFSFAWLDATAQADFISSAFGLSAQDYPQLVVLNAKKKLFAPLVGSFTGASIESFLTTVVKGKTKTSPLLSKDLPALAGTTKKCAAGASSSSSSSSSGGAKAKPAAGSSSSGSSSSSSGAGSGSSGAEKGVSTVLTTKNFDNLVLKSKGVWIVEFFAPWCGHCKSLAPEWAKAAKASNNLVHFGTVDATVETALAGKYGIKGYPTIKTFGPGKKSGASDYQGARTAKAILDGALGLLSGKLVATISSADTFTQWRQKASDAGKIAAVLVSDKASTTPNLLKSLSAELEGEVNFALLKSSVADVVSTLGVTSFPALVYYKPGEDATVYSGELNYDGLIRVLGSSSSTGGASSSSSSSSGGSGSAEAPPKPVEKSVVRSPTSTADFTAQCLNARVCVLALHTPESDDSTPSTILADVAKHFDAPLVSFVDIDRASQPAIARALDLSPEDTSPLNIAIVATKQKRFVSYVGAFDAESIVTFIQGALHNKIRMYGMPSELTWTESVTFTAGDTASASGCGSESTVGSAGADSGQCTMGAPL